MFNQPVVSPLPPIPIVSIWPSAGVGPASGVRGAGRSSSLRRAPPEPVLPAGAEAAPTLARAPAISGALGAFTGVLVPVAIHPLGPSFADPYVSLGIDSRLHIPVAHGTAALVLEGNALVTIPVFVDGTTAGGEYALRVGFAQGNWRATFGVSGRIDPAVTRPVSVPLPSLSVRWQAFSSLAFSAGIFDRPGRPMFHLGVEHRYFGVQFAAFYGAEVYGRLPLRGDFMLEARVYAYQILSVTPVGALLGVVWTPGYRPGATVTSAAVW